MRSEIGIPLPGAEVRLATDVHYPTNPNGIVVVIRTPYSKASYCKQANSWTNSGFTLVVQDVRGRYDSSGTFVPYKHEMQDSRDCYEWIVEQKWCESVLAMGSSYEAATAWAGAASLPASYMLGVVSKVPTLGTGRVKLSASGILRFQEHVSWWLAHGGTRTSREYLPDQLEAAASNLMAAPPAQDILRRLGLDDSCLGGSDAAIVAAQSRDVTFDEVISEKDIASLNFPSLHVGGWHDLQVDETYRHFQAADRGDHSSTLLVGDWGHDLGQSQGSTDAGRFQLKWIESIKKSRPSPASQLWDPGQEAWVGEPADHPQVESFAAVSGFGLSQHSTQPQPVSFSWNPLETLNGKQTPGHVWQTEPLPSQLVIHGRPSCALSLSVPHDPLDWVVELYVTNRNSQRRKLASGVAPSQTHSDQVHVTLSFCRFTCTIDSALSMVIRNSDFPKLSCPLSKTQCRYSTTTVDDQNWSARVLSARIDLPITNRG